MLTKHRFTVDEYYRMAETGIIKPDARVELLEGEIIDMMPMGPFHAGSVDRLAELFIMAGGNRWHVRSQNPIRISEDSEPRPDLALVRRRKDFYTGRHPAPEDVHLIIEVADSSHAFDREQKLPVYGKAGIPEVWIVNLPERSIEIYREPHFTGYALQRVVHEDGSLSPATFPDVVVRVAEVLASSD